MPLTISYNIVLVVIRGISTCKEGGKAAKMYIYNTEDIQSMSLNTNKKDFSRGGGDEVQADDRYCFKSRQLQIKYFTHS